MYKAIETIQQNSLSGAYGRCHFSPGSTFKTSRDDPGRWTAVNDSINPTGLSVHIALQLRTKPPIVIRRDLFPKTCHI